MANALLVGTGLATVGLASFVALALAARSLSAQAFAHFATWWTSATLLGLAFAVIEMYLPRLLVAAQAGLAEDRALVASFTRGLLAAVAAVAAVVVATVTWSVHRLFGGSWALVGLLIAYLAVMALQSMQRAVAVGRDRFTVFPAQMGGDGLVRMLGTTVAWAVGASNPATFAAALCCGAAFGLIAGTPANPAWLGWARPLARVPLTPLGLLMAASLGPLVVNNAGVPWMSAQGAPALAVGAVAGALTLSRVPTLMVGSAYGPVLTPLARAVDERAPQTFQRAHVRAVSAAVVLASAFVLAFVLLGPELLALYLGDRYVLDRVQLAAMAAGSGLMFVCVVEQAALVAMSAWHPVALGWAAGLTGFAVVLSLPVDETWAVSLGVLVAPLVALLVMAVGGVLVQRKVFAGVRT